MFLQPTVSALLSCVDQVMEEALSHLSLVPGEAEDLCQVHDYSGAQCVSISRRTTGNMAVRRGIVNTSFFIQVIFS